MESLGKGGREWSGLASQGDEEGDWVGFGKWVAGVRVLVRPSGPLCTHRQTNSTHPPTQPYCLCKASFLACIACRTAWYVLVVCGLPLPLTSSSSNHDQFHLKCQPKTTFHSNGVQLARDWPLQRTQNNCSTNKIFKIFIDKSSQKQSWLL